MNVPPARIAVSGALGFVGSRLVPRLIERGAHVIAVVRPGREDEARDRGMVDIRAADLGDSRAAAAALADAGALIHLSGLSQVAGLVPLIERGGPRRGIFVSSAGVRTRLASASADAKREGELALRASSLDFTIIRPTMVYGLPGDRNVERLLLWLRRSRVIVLPSGDTLQQPVHVDDLVECILAALDRPISVRAEYDIGGPEALPLHELVRIAARILDRRPIVIPASLGLAHWAVVTLRRLGLESPVRPEQILRLAESKAVDIEPARRDLGFHPRGLATGLETEVRLLSGR